MSSSTKVVSKRSSRSSVKELPLPEEKLKEMYRQMLLIRRFEEKTGQQYQLKKFSGFCHLYIGQEAVAVGTIAALQVPKDYVFTTYRDHAHALLLGVPAREVMAELFMKGTGCSKGKGGSMHMYNGKMRYMGGNGIIGGHIPLAIGAAFASKYRNEGAISVCYMGDATINQGTFHESLNMAGIWKLPTVFIVENNFYGMGTAISRTSAQPDLYKRTGDAYQIPGIRVNGMDVLEVYEAMKDAAESARAGQPVFLEMVTYRYRGHSMSDPATTYRNKDEVHEWQNKDPMASLAQQFPDIFAESWLSDLEAEVKAEVEDAVNFADESEYPDQADVWTHVYADYPGYPGPEVNPNKYAFPYNEFP